MDGGATEFVPDLPYEVSLFRKIVNSMKRVIIRELEEDGPTEQIQGLENADRVEAKLKRLGQMLLKLLQGGDASETLARIFQGAGLNLAALSLPNRELCEYYVDIDIRKYPWDLSPEHIDSVKSWPF